MLDAEGRQSVRISSRRELLLRRSKGQPAFGGRAKQILNAPLGRTVWVGPVSGAELYRFENSEIPKSIMIAAWKSVHVSYGECYAMMLMDESVFENLFASLQDGKSACRLSMSRNDCR